MSTQVVKGPIEIGIQEIKTDTEGLSVQYRQNDGEWSSNISLNNLASYGRSNDVLERHLEETRRMEC
jgi:hypothetical protein